MAYLRDNTSTLDAGARLGLPGLKPHIRPGVLYPAVANIMVDGSTALSATTVGPNASTVTSSKYGTVQSDGRMYYYTDIKGSKPIKDPRIGAHFGSQRHKFKSLQLLEQETATHGKNVFSVDGREWIRGVGNFVVQNHDHGNDINFSGAGDFFEVTGYFNDFNVGMFTYNNRNVDVDITIDGTLTIDGSTTLSGNSSYAGNPLMSRFVDPHSLINGGLSIALGLHTLKFEIKDGSKQTNCNGIELIAQDTTSTATKSKIQIPSQNVVSYGKKFTVSGTPHYDPFDGFTNSTDLHSAYVDTATSLGLSTAIAAHGAPWAISGSNNIRPYNGGRVVKWVDSSGVIKTSVNMMPPNAQNIAGTAAAEITTPSATNTAYLPAFSDDAVDHSLAEVAKTFHCKEFGNGAANGGTGATYADASMLSGSHDDMAYVMDDGLTSIAGDNCRSNIRDIVIPNGIDDNFYITFIGTGVAIKGGTYGPGIYHIAQNLPYGTHILKSLRNSSPEHPNYTIDGIALGQTNNGTYGSFQEVTFHQPKMPPIPEDAVILSDYMLMADFVPQTSREVDKISKGVKRVNSSRDLFYDTNSGSITFTQASPFGVTEQFGFDAAIFTGTRYFKLPYFGTGNLVHFRGNSGDRATDITYSINGNAVTDANFSGISRLSASSSGITFDTDGTYGQNVGSQVHNFAGVKGGISLGLNTIKNQATESNKYLSIDGIDIATPIHTSSHYQTFETPFLHELVGGDRNMEQTNLVVTPDGKTWDEITRDTSYIGKGRVSCNFVGTATGLDALVYMDDWRGVTTGTDYYNKDFAIAYDRFICLVPGNYTIVAQSMMAIALTGGNHVGIYINGLQTMQGHIGTHSYSTTTPMHVCDLQRGDYVQLYGRFRAEQSRSGFYIERN